MSGPALRTAKAIVTRGIAFVSLSLFGSLLTLIMISRIYLDWRLCNFSWTGVAPRQSIVQTFRDSVSQALTAEAPHDVLFLLGLEALPFAGFALVVALSKSSYRRGVALFLWALLVLFMFAPYFNPRQHHSCNIAGPDTVFAFAFFVITWPMALAILLLPTESRARRS